MGSKNKKSKKGSNRRGKSEKNEQKNKKEKEAKDEEPQEMKVAEDKPSKKKEATKKKKHAEKEKPVRLTMAALQDISSSEDEGGKLPEDESEWGKDALALRDKIAAGAFDHLLNKGGSNNKDDAEEESSIEEVVIDKDGNVTADDDDDEDGSIEQEEAEEEEEEEDDDASSGSSRAPELLDLSKKKSSADDDGEEDDSENDRSAPKLKLDAGPDDEEEDESPKKKQKRDSKASAEDDKKAAKKKSKKHKDGKADDAKLEGESKAAEADSQNAASDDEEEQEGADKKELSLEEKRKLFPHLRSLRPTTTELEKNNQMNSKALHVVTLELQAAKRKWPWAEKFDIVSTDALPFRKSQEAADHANAQAAEQSGDEGAADVAAAIDIHDDLKRETTFYDFALKAALEARKRCQEAKVPFSRPDDFFAEMLKTDDHMAVVKDRLIFESKKIQAVQQRKANKEQKLRARESHANKMAEKSKRKRQHFEALEEWKQDRENRSSHTSIIRRNNPVNKRREAANRKYGYGGKRGGRFKQNDRASLNDMSDFNFRGHFEGGMRSGPSNNNKRKGKRARDAANRERGR